MKWPWVWRSTMELAVVHETRRADAWIASHALESERRALTWEEARRTEARHNALLEKYHELRQTHDAPIKYDVPAATEHFGPLTRMALAEMARGQSGHVVRAMRDKALVVWLENRASENQDELAAIAVRSGEPLG